jgi:hypothetical protein
MTAFTVRHKREQVTGMAAALSLIHYQGLYDLIPDPWKICFSRNTVDTGFSVGRSC